MAQIQVGDKFTKTFIVTKDMLASVVGSGSVAVAADCFNGGCVGRACTARVCRWNYDGRYAYSD